MTHQHSARRIRVVFCIDIRNDSNLQDLSGHLLYNKAPNTPEAHIDVSALAPGMYLIRINDAVVRKFVKE